jgi:hypothetical protein
MHYSEQEPFIQGIRIGDRLYFEADSKMIWTQGDDAPMMRMATANYLSLKSVLK